MYRLTLRLALVLACCLGLTQTADAAAARDTSRTARRALSPQASAQQARFGGDPVPGTCIEGTANRELDINNVRARMYNTGSLFFGATGEAQYVVPAASGNSPIYASGIWIGGTVDGQVRVAGATYADYEFWPGPLDGATARPINPADCSGFDRIFKVGRADIANYLATGSPAPDLRDWPVQWGAEYYVDANLNGRRDSATEPILVRNEGDPGYGTGGAPLNLAAGERPNLIGDQAMWWVMNDVGNVHANSGSSPLGVEVQVQTWAFSRSDALGDATFYRYRVINKSGRAIEDTYLSIFSDPDLGDAADDLVGVDTSLSLGYVYNSDNDDGVYGIPPAAGYDFFQGPIVNGDTLGATTFMYFINGQSPPLLDPNDAAGIYFVQQGRWTDGTPMTTGGNGYQQTGPETVFAFPGDPVTNQFWSEVNPGGGTPNPGDDRRLVLSTGPFSLEPDVPQDIVYGIVFGQGSSNLSSITVLRQSSALAQTAYDINFELASPPPAPPLCNADSSNPQLLPGSGRCAEFVESDGRLTLTWGYPDAENILGFQEVDRLLATNPDADAIYQFEGFNIYRYPDGRFRSDDAELVATFDVDNGVTQVIDFALDPNTNEVTAFVAARGTDSGVQYTFDIPNLTNYTDYYYAITAYSYNEESIPKVLESAPRQLTGRPSSIAGANGGTVAQSEFGQLVRGSLVSGISNGSIYARVVNPQAVRAATYRIEFFDLDTDGTTTTTYRILRNGTEVYDGAEVYTQTDSLFVPGSAVGPFDNVQGNNVIIDGLEFFSTDLANLSVPAADADNVPDIAGNGRGVLEVAAPGSAVTCPDPSLASDYGCVNYNNAGNTVSVASTDTAVDGGVNDTYFVSTVSGTLAGATGIIPFEETAAGSQIEIRFTAQGGYAVQTLALGANATRKIYTVPFEVWNVGQRPNDPSDDVRMIPFIGGMPANVFDWSQSYTSTLTVAGADYLRSAPIFAYMPDRPNGYELFEDAAIGFGGAGADYVRANDGDTQTEPSARSGGDCTRQNFYVSFCYRDDLFGDNIGVAGAYLIGNTVFADITGAGQPPATGTVVRILTTPRATSAQPGDVYEFDTASLALVTGDADAAADALELIGIVPNPYLGSSSYETGNLERIARFTNMPQEATIRVYTVSGSLVRTLRKDGPSRSVDWDLTTESGLPVASGMYLIHVDVPGVGERVLKFGVVNRTTQIPVF